jgi:hypothetical protein
LIEEGADADEVFGRLAGTFKNQASTAANTTSGKMKNLSIQMGEFKESIGAAVAPLIQKMLPALLQFSTFAQENTKLIVILGAVIGTFALAIIGLNAGLAIYNTIQALTLALNTALTASFSALWIATGVVVIIAIIAALVALQVKFDIFGKTVNAVKTVFTQLWDVARFVFGAIKQGFSELKDLGASIFDGIGVAFKGVINAVISAMEKGLNFAIKGLNIILDGIDKAAGPWINFGTIPEVKLPRLAEGGITTGPTIAMIGEKGPEAVIPLDRLGSMGMGGANITVNVNGGDPNAVVAALRTYMFRNGPLPITVA